MRKLSALSMKHVLPTLKSVVLLGVLVVVGSGQVLSAATIGEAGTVSEAQSDVADWFPVPLTSGLIDPIVVVGPLSRSGNQPVVTQTRLLGGGAVEWRMAEWEYLPNRRHTRESAGFLALERGQHPGIGGDRAEADHALATDAWQTVGFASAFAAPPVVLAQVVEDAGGRVVTTRIKDVTSTGFDLRIQGQEADGPVAGFAVVHWIALPAGSYPIGAQQVIAGQTGATVDQGWETIPFGASFPGDPAFVASLASEFGSDTAALRHRRLDVDDVQVRVEEERSNDNETSHADEIVHWVAMSPGVWSVDLSGDRIGPFRWARRFLDPDAPDPVWLARDGNQEDAQFLGGDDADGCLTTTQWSGDNQAGGRLPGGPANTFAAEPGENFWIALKQWTIREGADAFTGDWHYYHEFQQDAHVRLGYLAANAGSLPMFHGVDFSLDSVLPANAIVVELAFRNRQGGGTQWQTGAHGGNPLEVGVWQIPAGMTLQAAQGDRAANLLSEITVLPEWAPGDPIAFKFQVQQGGHWQLRLDFANDSVVDIDLQSGTDGNATAGLVDVTEASGLLVTTLPAGGAHPGIVNDTDIDLGWRREDSAPIEDPATDRRPLIAKIPAVSYFSPVKISGLRWGSSYDVSVAVPGDPTAPVWYFGDRQFFSQVPLVDGGLTSVHVEQTGTPPTPFTGSIEWLALNLADYTEICAPTGSSVRLTYAPSYDGYDGKVQIDFGDGSAPVEVDPGEVVVHDYSSSSSATGFFEALAFLDEDGDGSYDAEARGTAKIKVADVKLPMKIASRVGYKRKLFVDTGNRLASDLWFGSDSGDLQVTLLGQEGNVAQLELKVPARGTPILLVKEADEAGAVLAEREIDEFTLTNDSRSLIHLVEPNKAIATLTLRPYLPCLNVHLEMFAHNASFLGGAKAFDVLTDGSPSTLGEQGFKCYWDPETEESVGIFRFCMDLPPDRSGGNASCYKFSVQQVGGD